MTKYVKYISETQIEYPPKNKGNIINYNLDVEAMIADGYKELVETERPVTNRRYHIEYQDGEHVFEFVKYDETQEEADARDLENKKQEKIQENDVARDMALNQGVMYQDVLFDSDTDQKANLIAVVMSIDDVATVEWYGMNNDSLTCTKQDLINIGGLITQLHTFCWTKNAEIKTEINEATTVEEVEAIIINYEILGE